MEDYMPVPGSRHFSGIRRKVWRWAVLTGALVALAAAPLMADPSAYSGEFQSVPSGATVTLDGTGSTNPTGYPLSYEWVQFAGPAVTLSNPSAAQPTFTAPAASSELELNFRLTVRDERGVPSSDPVTVFVQPVIPGNTAPTSDAGPDQFVDEGSTVFLNGSGFDPDAGETLRYEWCQCKRTFPHVELADNTNPVTSFVVPRVAKEEPVFLNLFVFDSKGVRGTNQIIVRIRNVPPVANAGADRTVNEGDIVFLDGTGSLDPGEATTLRWEQVSGPPAPLNNATLAEPKFKAPFVEQPTDLVFRLTLTDGAGAVTNDDVTITVQDIGISQSAGPNISEFLIIPNPSRPSDDGVTFQYTLNAPSSVTITIHDLLGRMVRKIDLPAGSAGAVAGINSFKWDARNGEGETVASDGYLVQLTATDAGGNKSKARGKAAVIR